MSCACARRGQVADVVEDLGAGRASEHARLALVLGHEAERDTDERRLPGAVLPEKAEDLARVRHERHAPEGLCLAIPLTHTFVRQSRHGAPSLPEW